MPFINIKTNAALSQEKKGIIKRRLFDCISVIPGKSDRYLMVALEDGLDMAFHRESEANIAFTEVKLFGGSTKDQPKTRPDSPVPSLQGPCDRSLKSEVPCGSCLNWR